MALSDVIVSFDIHQLLGGDFDARRTKAYVTVNTENARLEDTSTGEVRIGDQTVTIASDGTGTFTTWAPGSDGNPVSWQTTLHLDYPRTGHRDRQTSTFGPYTITGTSKTVSNKALTSNVATITTSTAHGLDVGNTVTIAGVDSTFNGSYTITAVPSTTTLSYAKTHADVASAAATGTLTSPNVRLTSLEDEQAIPAEYQTAFTESMEEIRDESAANLAAQITISGIDDTDSAVAGLISNDLVGPLTNAALAAEYAAKPLDDTAADLEAAAGVSLGQGAFANDTALPYRWNGSLWTRYTKAVNALAIPGIDPSDRANWPDKIHAVAKLLQAKYGGGDIYLPNDVQWLTRGITDTAQEYPSGQQWPRPALVLRKGINYLGDKTELVWDSTTQHTSFIGTRPGCVVPWPPWSADPNATPKAVISSNIALGDSTFTVNSSAAFAVGDDVVLRLGQIANDTNEPLSVQFGIVTAIPDATHITLDIQADVPIVIADQTTSTSGSGPWTYLATGSGGVDNPGAHSIYRVSEIADGHAEGFSLSSPNSGGKYPSQSIVSFYSRGATFADLLVHNGGAPAIYYSHDVTVNDLVCTRADYLGGNTATGRVVNVGSGSRNIVFNRVGGKNFEGVAVLVEAAGRLVIRDLRLENTHATRANSTVPVLQTQGGSKLVVDDLVLGGSATSLRPNDTAGGTLEDIVIRGDVDIKTNTAMLNLQPRDFKDGLTLSNGNLFDAPSRQRYGRPVRWRRKIKLTSGVGPVIQIPDGLIARGSIYASTLTGLTTLLLDNGTLSYGLVSSLTAGATTVLPNRVTGLGANTAIWWGGKRFNRTLTATCSSSVPKGAYLIVELWYMPPLDDENTGSGVPLAAASADADVALAAVDACKVQAAAARVTVTNTTTETAIASFTLPKAAVFPGVNMNMQLGGYNDFAAGSGILRFRMRLGSVSGTSVVQIDVPTQVGASTIQKWTIDANLILQGVAGAATACRLGGTPALMASDALASALPFAGTVTTMDTTADTELVWTAQWLTLASTSNIVRCDNAVARLENYPVERA